MGVQEVEGHLQAASTLVPCLMLLKNSGVLGSILDILTCTETLQQWNIPRPKRLPLIPVCDLSSRSHEILQKEKKGTSLNAFRGHLSIVSMMPVLLSSFVAIYFLSVSHVLSYIF